MFDAKIQDGLKSAKPAIKSSLGNSVEVLEEILLDGQVLDDGLDDEVGVLDGLGAGVSSLQEVHSLTVLKLDSPVSRRLDVLDDTVNDGRRVRALRGDVLRDALRGFADDGETLPAR